MNVAPLYELPLALILVFVLAVLAIAIELGFRIGLRMKEVWKDADSGGGAIVVSAMFALLGLVLAFTYSASVSRFDARKAAVIIEANALGTAYARADLALEPSRTELKRALLDYARTRTMHPGTVTSQKEFDRALERTMRAQQQIWPTTKRAFAASEKGASDAALVASINSVFDAHTTRWAAIIDKLPEVVFWMLLIIAAASLSVAGYNAGIQGQMSRWRMSAFAVVLSGMMVVILDFDRPNDGLVVVRHTVIDEVIADMEAYLEK